MGLFVFLFRVTTLLLCFKMDLLFVFVFCIKTIF